MGEEIYKTNVRSVIYICAPVVATWVSQFYCVPTNVSTPCKSLIDPFVTRNSRSPRFYHKQSCWYFSIRQHTLDFEFVPGVHGYILLFHSPFWDKSAQTTISPTISSFFPVRTSTAKHLHNFLSFHLVQGFSRSLFRVEFFSVTVRVKGF